MQSVCDGRNKRPSDECGSPASSAKKRQRLESSRDDGVSGASVEAATINLSLSSNNEEAEVATEEEDINVTGVS